MDGLAEQFALYGAEKLLRSYLQKLEGITSRTARPEIVLKCMAEPRKFAAADFFDESVEARARALEPEFRTVLGKPAP